jgi:hypothetical protein
LRIVCKLGAQFTSFIVVMYTTGDEDTVVSINPSFEMYADEVDMAR